MRLRSIIFLLMYIAVFVAGYLFLSNYLYDRRFDKYTGDFARTTTFEQLKYRDFWKELDETYYFGNVSVRDMAIVEAVSNDIAVHPYRTILTLIYANVAGGRIIPIKDGPTDEKKENRRLDRIAFIGSVFNQYPNSERRLIKCHGHKLSEEGYNDELIKGLDGYTKLSKEDKEFVDRVAKDLEIQPNRVILTLICDPFVPDGMTEPEPKRYERIRYIQDKFSSHPVLVKKLIHCSGHIIDPEIFSRSTKINDIKQR